MNIELRLIEQIIQDNHILFKEEILHEFSGLIRLDKAQTHTVGNTIRVFQIREQTQQEKDAPIVIGFEELLKNLKKIPPTSTLHQVFLAGEHYGFLLFVNLTQSIVYGALKFLEQKIDRSIELTSTNTLKGTWTDTSFYLNREKL